MCFVSTKICKQLKIQLKKLTQNFGYKGIVTVVKKSYNDYKLRINETEFTIRLLPIAIRVIGMDWLHNNHAQIVCNKKLIKI